MGHSPGAGYPSSCFVRDESHQLSVSLLDNGLGVMGLPSPFSVGRLLSVGIDMVP